MKLIDLIKSPTDLKKLNIKQKKVLAKEIRKYLLEVTSKNGGHIASNLGVVELTIAIHSVFNAPKDKIVWDVGHQSYVHKILTGRKEELKTIRKYHGLSGFPKRNESKYDTFNTGHSSTSLSAAAGMARARDLKGGNNKIVAVIGDGALTGGMALEALNDIGSSNLDMTVILNDNEMSISKNVGGIPLLLSKLRTKKTYVWLNSKIKNFTKRIPLIGNFLVEVTRYIKNILKRFFIKEMYFEDIGFFYLGPIDGHDINELEDILERSKKIKGPVLVHVITKKGKGYKFAEENPDKFHGISPFDIKTGETIKPKKQDYSATFGHKLCELAQENNKIIAITAAMTDGTGLKEFSQKYPKRFFDVGIAEQHAICLAAGLASQGIIPVVSIYSSFLQRAYDQIIHDIALQRLHVVICLDRAGNVGNDGETHHGIFDLSYLSAIPNLTIMAPKNFEELELMLDYAINELDGPVAIRYPRGGEGTNKLPKSKKIVLGEPEIIERGDDITIIAIGNMVDRALEVSKILKKKAITTQIINARFLKPLKEKSIVSKIKNSKLIVTIEDNLIKDGLQDTILEIINNNDLKIKLKAFGYETFASQGSVSELENEVGLDAENIAKKIIKELK